MSIKFNVPAAPRPAPSPPMTPGDRVTYRPAGERRDWNLPPDMSALGSGYNIFGHFAYSGASMARIFDWSYADTVRRGNYDIPSMVNVTRTDSTRTLTFQGETRSEIQKSMSDSVKLGGSMEGVFSVSLSTSFSSSQLKTEKRFYTIIQRLLVRNQYSFNPRAVRHLLTAEFRHALATNTPEEIFEYFGTHFPTRIVTGARLDYSSSTRSLQNESTKDIAATATASLTMVIGADAEYTHTSKSSIKEFQESSESELNTYGGSLEKAGLITGTGDTAKNIKDYEGWVGSITGNEVLIECGLDDSLHGVWELCDDNARREEIKAAALEFIGRKSEGVRIGADRIVDVAVIAGKNAHIEPPEGYEKVSDDLNKGAGGYYIYACFKSASSLEIAAQRMSPVVDLAVIMDKEPVPHGFDKIPVDLNKEAKGKYIYLCTRSAEPGTPDVGIKDIKIITGSHAGLTKPFGYKQLPQDLNAGAGGDFIYLCYI